MQADINGNPVLLEFEEFKKLDLPERRQVLFSFLVDLLPLLDKMTSLEITMEDLTLSTERIEDELMLKAFNYYLPTKELKCEDDSFMIPSALNIINSRKTHKRCGV